MARKPKAPKRIETLTHDAATRTNIPTAEFESVMEDADKTPIRLAYERRNRDLDPQLVWRGKDEQDLTDLVVTAPPLFIQEKVHPKALIDALARETRKDRADDAEDTPDLFAEFNGLDDPEAKTEFYAHAQNWTNRLILGDSLQVMASLAEREGLRGKVQAIYLDPPYGIKFNSNFQWSTTSRDVKDGNADHITREPEQVKAFRDTWRDGIHTYLSYLRDRMTVARDLLTESGSIFVQIGDENVHRVRALMDEVFGEENFVAQITVRVKSPLSVSDLARTTDFIIWYAKSRGQHKFRKPTKEKRLSEHPEFSSALDAAGISYSRKEIEHKNTEWIRYYTSQNLASSGYTQSCTYNYAIEGKNYGSPKGKSWKTHLDGMNRLEKAGRLQPLKTSLRWRYFHEDALSEAITDIWGDTFAASDKVYVVQTSESVIQRCLLMTTDPGDLVLDPTCGSGTTAYVAEQWGRRWITIDTSRVALALARARLMGARYPWYIIKDSPEGLEKEAELARTPPKETPTYGDIRQGFVYERVPHITLKAIANNAEIDTIWEEYQPAVEEALKALNAALKGHATPFKVETGGRKGETIDFAAPDGETVELPSGEHTPKNGFLEWEVPREAPEGAGWPPGAQQALERFWEARIARQQEIDKSIAANADQEYLYDRPYEDKSRVRVAGPFTVESLSPHRALAVGADDELIDLVEAADGERAPSVREEDNFVSAILENLRVSGVQQAHKEDRISFTDLTPWPGDHVCAEGRYEEGGTRKRAGILIGPEYGTIARPDLVAAAREAAEAGFDVVIACAFNFDAHAEEFEKLGRIPVLKARMNPDLHMADELKTTKGGNLFVVFGEPDIDLVRRDDGKLQVEINGVDVFKPSTGKVESSGPDGIACWFLDDDYDEESFFVRHAYFLGAGTDPYKALKTTLKAEIDEDAWATLKSNVSRPFDPPESGRIAVKVINHLGDEVMKVFEV
ncbi:site-specific DNA-methyltransferase [Marinicauda salina]|uniref:site-specific DNA-methyltransferase (adenine-specific) n=1 Tax=Marinicauda salina TaxID=2135793 RepID=A0A2U2BSZ3_9PROT|nr:site-specific DNA-methyltransferase [Marinicauda salina]PWE17127.1 site-specific DNA-methyltransferase [Marinicauda salina]